jgi:hypothetical protein
MYGAAHLDHNLTADIPTRISRLVWVIYDQYAFVHGVRTKPAPLLPARRRFSCTGCRAIVCQMFARMDTVLGFEFYSCVMGMIEMVSGCITLWIFLRQNPPLSQEIL